MLLGFFKWMAETPWSVALHESLYGYPIVESVHVWALCLFVGLAVVLDLRLTGLSFTTVPISQLSKRILPWTTFGFVIMVLSGVLLFYAIPIRSYQNIFFRAKLVLLLLAGVNAWVFHPRGIPSWDKDPVPPRSARFAGWASLVLWMTIIFCGRMIAYNWFDCDRPDQTRIISTLSGCEAPQ